MNIQRISQIVIASLFGALIVAGCGGTDTGLAPPAPNQFAGAFRGQFLTVDRAALGTMDNVVDMNGKITGMTNNFGDAHSIPSGLVVHGTVGNDGAINVWFGQHHLTGMMHRDQARGAGKKFAGGELLDHFDGNTRLFEWWNDTVVSN